MSKKALLITTVSGFVPQFEMENVKLLQELGYEVHYASNFKNPHYGTDNRRLKKTGIQNHQIDFVRSPYHFWQNLKAYHQLVKLLQEDFYELIHCHTPMGAVLARLAVRRVNGRKKGIYVIYTAHGFHFYQGAPLRNWILYYPVERWLAKDTDLLITMNEEDTYHAKKMCRYLTTKVKWVHGVGIDLSYWTGKDLTSQEKQYIRTKIRKRLGISEKATIYLSVGELSKRKNHRVVISAFTKLKQKQLLSEQSYYLIAGKGTKFSSLRRQIYRAGLQKQILLLGYRQDIRELLFAADVFLFPSLQEGMPVALLEAAAAGLDLLAEDIRGNQEILQNTDGILISGKNKGAWIKGLQLEQRRREQKDLIKVPLEQFSIENRLKLYDKAVIKKQMKRIYEAVTLTFRKINKK